jgi:hypothetical protein
VLPIATPKAKLLVSLGFGQECYECKLCLRTDKDWKEMQNKQGLPSGTGGDEDL